jgi:rRNA pseudouridine-1189 N-methylase Emg1 (Nep1/Mra1 family)
MNCKPELKFLKVVIAPQIYVPINHIRIIALVIQLLDLRSGTRSEGESLGENWCKW